MSEPLALLHAHSGNMFGGIESILVTLARFDDPRLRHTFALSSPGRLASELEEVGADVRIVGPARISRPWKILKARAGLRDLLGASEFDVTICHSAWSRLVFGPVLRAACPTPIMWQHSAVEREHWIDRLSRRVTMDLVICNSQFTCERQRTREPSIPTEVLYAPVPPPSVDVDRSEERRRVRTELGIEDDTILLLQTGRLERGKGHSILLEAVAALPELANWYLVQVGAASRRAEHRYEAELQELIVQLGLQERVSFVGEKASADEYYAAGDIYCQPCIFPESFGVAFVEALYAGLPVITTNIGAAPEIITPDCGMLVPSGDVGALSEALRKLVCDRAVRTTLGKNGPPRARSLCGPSVCVTRLQKILSGLSG